MDKLERDLRRLFTIATDINVDGADRAMAMEMLSMVYRSKEDLSDEDFEKLKKEYNNE